MKRLVHAIDEAVEYGGLKGKFTVAAVSAVALVLSLASVSVKGVDPVWIAILLCGAPIFWEATRALTTRADVKADLLVVIAMAASIYLEEYFAAGEVAFIMKLGETLEDWATSRARSEISGMSEQIPLRARLLNSLGNERVVEVEELRVGDVVRIAPGERIPVDGRILSGDTTIDEQALTGESTPVEKSVSSKVFSGSINLCGSFDMVVEKEAADSSYQRVVSLVRSADVDDVRFVRIADRWATILVFCSLATAIVTYLITRDLRRAATVLVVFCPCAFVLATPTALLAALSAATRRRVFLKSADTLERLAKVDCVAFDKTGTLTEGKMNVTGVKSLVDDMSTDEVWNVAAALEARSEHPVGRAIAISREGVDELIEKVERFSSTPGRGVSGYIDGRLVCVGTDSFVTANGTLPFNGREVVARNGWSDQASVVFVSVEGRLVGCVAISDTIRESAAETVARLRSLGLRVLLLSGDSVEAVHAVAERLGIEECRARLLPVNKSDAIDELRRAGRVVCMVGDGFNDAPALKRADVGVSLGGVGSNIATEASDIVLYRDEISELPFAVSLARRAVKTVKSNLILSTVLNALGVSLAVLGVLSPVTGALVHNASSLATILNSLRLLPSRKRATREPVKEIQGVHNVALVPQNEVA